MAILSPEKVKTVLQIKDNTKDSAIAAVIPIVEEFIKRKTRNSFLNGESIEVFPEGVKLTALEIIRYLITRTEGALQSETIGTHSWTYLNDLPPVILQFLKPYTKVIWA